jgi:hypothetical protein
VVAHSSWATVLWGWAVAPCPLETEDANPESEGLLRENEDSNFQNEDSARETEGLNPASENSYRETENSDSQTEDSERKTEDSNPKTEDLYRESEDSDFQSESSCRENESSLLAFESSFFSKQSIHRGDAETRSLRFELAKKPLRLRASAVHKKANHQP